MGNIMSNMKAQGQKIYKSTKDLILEDGIIQKSLDGAIDKVGAQHQKNYNWALGASKGAGNWAGIDEITKKKGKALKKTPEKMSILGSSLSENQLSKVGNTVANRSALGYSDLDKSYDKLLKKTKGSIGMNMAGNVASNYYINPFKDGIGAMGSTKFKDNKDLHKGIARVGVASAGVAGAVAIGSSMNDDDLKNINARLKTQYDEGSL